VSLVAVVGDGCTTTALGIAVAWPLGDSRIVAEFDPAGGCLAAWLGVPRSPGLAEVAASSTPGSWSTIQSMVQRAQSGVDVLVAPTRAVEAAAVVQAATASVLPVLAALEQPVVFADGGRLRGGLSNLVVQSSVVVVAHRQHSGSAAAAALGIERVAELTSQLAARSIPTVVALIGSVPYTADEVSDFVRADAVVALADDPWAAAVLAGRAGSAIRLRRSALMRSLDELVGVVGASLRHVGPNDQWSRSVNDRVVDDRTLNDRS
jgi:MinD-like ATPase involved in chromosome partitioning or flagellar assembly